MTVDLLEREISAGCVVPDPNSKHQTTDNKQLQKNKRTLREVEGVKVVMNMVALFCFGHLYAFHVFIPSFQNESLGQPCSMFNWWTNGLFGRQSFSPSFPLTKQGLALFQFSFRLARCQKWEDERDEYLTVLQVACRRKNGQLLPSLYPQPFTHSFFSTFFHYRLLIPFRFSPCSHVQQ